MPAPSSLTEFQQTSARQVEQLCERFGAQASFEVQGVQEAYLYARVKDIDIFLIDIFLYEDGGDIHLHDHHRLFEWQNYDSLQELQRAFLAELEKVLTAGGGGRPGKP